MKIALIGSRTFTDADRDTLVGIMESSEEFLDKANYTYLVGGAAGAQAVLTKYMTEEEPMGYRDVVLFKPWHLIHTALPFSPSLFFWRNKQIIDNADKVVVIQDERPGATADAEVNRTLEYAQKRNKDVVVFAVKD